MNIDFHKKFLKSYPKLDIKIRKKFDEKLEIFGKIHLMFVLTITG